MKAISALLGVLFYLPYEGSLTPRTVMGGVDVSAVVSSWRIKGVLTCPHHGHLRPCLWVENAYPCGILEVVRRPGTTHLKLPLPFVPSALTSSAGSDRGQTNLQFADARVYTFIPQLPEGFDLPLAQPRGPFFQVNYVSELDAWAWRTGLLDRVMYPGPSAMPCDRVPEVMACAGRWGNYYPRQGFLVHQSEPMASLLQALRAGRVANAPAGRFVMSPYPYEPRTGHFIQQFGRRAMRIGAPGPVDVGVGTSHGAYLYVHYGIFEECRRCLPPRLVGPR